jgi:hypothetical protein
MCVIMSWVPPLVILVAIESFVVAFGSSAFTEYELLNVWRSQYPERRGQCEQLEIKLSSLEPFNSLGSECRL